MALYASESWSLKKIDNDQLLAFKMYCYRRILRLSWTQKVKNVEIRERLNIKEDIFQNIMRRKLKLFGHIMRMNNSRKIKGVMLASMDGTNNRGKSY